MTIRSAIAQKFIHDAVGEALNRAGLESDNPIRKTLELEAEIVAERDAVVRVPTEDRLILLDDRIEQLRRDMNHANAFPPATPTVPKRDMVKLCQNFEKIIDGTVRVE